MTDQRKRYHINKPAETKFPLIADSQARELVAGNLNILSDPSGSIVDANKFISNDQQYELIILFTGGNDLFSGCVPSYKPPSQVTSQLPSPEKEGAFQVWHPRTRRKQGARKES